MLPPALTFDPGKSELKVSGRSLSREHISGLFGAPRPGHPDFPAFTVALILLEDLLYDELHTSRQLADHPIARAGDRFFNYGLISLSTARPREALEVVFEVLERLTANPLPVTELQGSIAVALTRRYRRLAAAAGARDRLAHWNIVGENWEHLDQLAPELRSVRPEQVQFVMRKYVRNIHFAVVGNPRKVPRQLLTSR
jgi:predicted Zn-dependent peptidase